MKPCCREHPFEGNFGSALLSLHILLPSPSSIPQDRLPISTEFDEALLVRVGCTLLEYM